ncbi:outer membrane protein TolC [Chitinivorax tropicus]|uniref:Outer membrane protein TolC n=1 Tax=Chitinivorax tropicus TaxID=714531 RepID=A0A840MNY9_9PROT|nr:TolC family protein [Chitinivorax tropicus]MBB5018462.1 outer membrane protein TolC [Chitinivorax tropicus]
MNTCTAPVLPTRWRCGLLILLGLLSGCANVDLTTHLDQVDGQIKALSPAKLTLARTADEQAERARLAQALLQSPITQQDAVRLALINSPSLQALLAQNWADTTRAAQMSRLPNPVFGFERMVSVSELELGRSLAIGLLDLLMLPKRHQLAQQRIEQSRLQLVGHVIDQITMTHQAWVRAVAAQETLHYARQIHTSAEAGAELARRMQAAGNFNRLSRLREHAFYADAATRLARAQHQATASREALIRQLGLDDQQAELLQLPARLPSLPEQAMDTQTASAQASRQRLDVQLAKLTWEATASAQGVNTVSSWTDIELEARRQTKMDRHDGKQEITRGYEVTVRLPIFDWGGLRRDGWRADTLAAANQLEATLRQAASSLREQYSAYRTAYDLARHYREEIIPLRKAISEENLLRYNGMLIGVFELLADAREQIDSVIGAIDAQQQFWLADAALQASLLGRPTALQLDAPSSAPRPANNEH